jgi:radical SAM superfamily enzyme YgiQ (UPF0313 family)
MKESRPRYKTAHLIYPHYPGVPDAGFAKVTLATLAAMLCDQFELTVSDEIDCGLADCNIKVDVAFLIALTGHENRIAELYQEFSSRGVLVVVGGPLATMSPELVRANCDVLVKGEIDDHYQELFAAIASGEHENEYVYDIASPGNSPVPRWDLLPSRHRDGAIQASRGCPYKCEFCLSAKYAGRKMRHKPAEQLIAELNNLYDLGYRFINFTDDNFTMDPRVAKHLLREVADWNSRQTLGECSFMLLASINCTRDEELLEHLRDANVRAIFIGIETPIEQSLRDSHKRHNLTGPPMVEQLQKFVKYGIMPSIGLTVGFDADPPDIWQRQLAFIKQSGVPIIRGGLLGAIHNSDLYLRLQREGREVDESFMQYPMWLNFEPLAMSRERMQLGLRWLLSNAYEPSAFGDRMDTMVQTMMASPHSKLAIPPIAEDYLMTRMEDCFQELAEIGIAEAGLASRGRRYVDENKDSVCVVLPIIDGYLYYRRNCLELGLFHPEYIGVDLEELFESEAPESETENRQRFVDGHDPIKLVNIGQA